jgi:hypothetical protein
MKLLGFWLFLLILSFDDAVIDSLSDPVSSSYHIQFLNVHGKIDSFMSDVNRQWIPMNISESLQYFTSYEVCSVFSGRHSVFCRERFDLNISKHAGKNAALLATCSVDMKGVGPQASICPNLFGTFYRHSSSTNPPPKGKTIVDFIFTSVFHGYDTLILVGDSITVQHYYDLYCQLHRYGLEASIFGHTIYVSNLDKYVNNHTIEYLEKMDEKEGRNKKEKNERGRSPLKHSTFVIRYQIVYNLYMWRKQVGWLQSVVSKQSDASVIMLFNLGLHFNYGSQTGSNQTELEKFYQRFFDYSLNTLIKKHQQIVFFRETSAQHFPTINGAFDSHNFSTNFKYDSREDPVKQLYDKNVADAGSVGGAGQQVMTNQENTGADVDLIDKRFPHKAFFTECVPILTKEQYDSQNWRNKLAEKVLSEIDPNHQEIPIIPFYSVTAGRYDLHSGRDKEDCTHYCHGPMLWLPVIHDLTLQMEKKFA